MFYCVLQGNFTNWLDGKPLTIIHWLDEDVHKKYIWREGDKKEVFTSENVKIDTIVSKKRSGQNLLQFDFLNCTAGYPSLSMIHLYWTEISCDEPFNASFVCQKDTHSYKPILWYFNSINNTCDQGWFLMKGTNKCYLLLATKSKISFLDAQYKCSQEQGSLLSIDANFGEYSSVDNQFILTLPNLRVSLASQCELEIERLNGSHLNRLLYGNLIRKDTNKLAALLPLALTGELTTIELLTKIKVFTFLGSYCGIIQYTAGFAAFSLFKNFPDAYMRGWGAKYRSCSQPIYTDVLICEKNPETPFSAQCSNNFFECDDKTCVLLLYECDSVTDCSDKSDESNCNVWSDNSNQNLTNQTISLPCQLHLNCSLYDNKSLLPLHYICDGIYSTYIFLKERKACHTIARPNMLSLDTSPTQTKNDNDQWDFHMAYTICKEKLVDSKRDRSAMVDATGRGHNHIYRPRNVMCSQEKASYLHERCKMKKRIVPCDRSSHTMRVCEDILCPGMFKCRDYYCIQISLVCDRQQDCMYGDDEKGCTDLACPGFLKCRGEMRCVGNDEICDGHLDCLHSFDDELFCNQSCPESCKCEGYMFSCSSTKNISDILYAKGLELTETHTAFEIHLLYLQYILYLSVTSCSVNNITFISKHNIRSPYLLFVNFQNNILSSLSFLINSFFLNIMTLDVSQNLISHINILHVQFQSLAVFYINGNPLKLINIRNTMQNLLSLHLKDVYYNYLIAINIPIDCEVIVSDYTLCCFLHSITHCISENGYKACFGLFEKLYSKCIFYILTLISIVVFIIQLFKIAYNKPWVKSQKKNYIITKFNHVIADLLIALYFTTLLLADILKLNIILWRQRPLCIFLKTAISVALHCSIIFKTVIIIIVALKLRYPFRHQLRFLRFIPQVTGFIWAAFTGLHLSNTLRVLFQIGGPYADMFCSCFDCHKQTEVFGFAAGFVDLLCILIFCFGGLSTYWHLKQKQKANSDMVSSKKIHVANITIRMIRPLSFDLFLRLIIITVQICKYLLTSFSKTMCHILILYLVPINLICNSLFNMMRF